MWKPLKCFWHLNLIFYWIGRAKDFFPPANDQKILGFKVAEKVYHKINFAAFLSQTPEGDFELPSCGQMYILDPYETVEEHLIRPLNYWISHNLMDLLEEILWDTI